MKVRMTLGWLLVLCLLAAIGSAQTPPAVAQGPALSLSEALAIARRNNPEYLQVLNDRTPASRNLLNATSSLFTPSFGIGGGYFWTDAGRQFLGGISFDGPTSDRTSGSLRLGYSLSGGIIASRGLAAAELRATDQDIAGASTVLETSVRTQYLTLAEAQAQEAVSRRAVERATEQLNLAQARYAVGQGTLIDVRRTEVDKGTAEVNLLRAVQNSENQVLVLYQRMGVPAPTVPAVTLTDSFTVITPPWQVDSLLSFAQAENPSLRSLRARRAAATWNTRSARSEYLPSLDFSASTGRTRNHIASYQVPDTAGNLITVPEQTEWVTSPWSVSVSISLPIYDRFARNTRIALASAREDDLRQQVRSRELAVRAEVVAAHNGLQAAHRAVAIQQANVRFANEALELATQRYRVGSGSFLELLDARLTADRADADHISAVYAYHRAIATLEQAVGRVLR
jgi:outer membrane protein